MIKEEKIERGQDCFGSTVKIFVWKSKRSLVEHALGIVMSVK